MRTPTPRGGELLRLAHTRPGLTRAEAARLLRASSGTTTDLLRDLSAARLLDERPGPPTGSRGRPTQQLVAHPSGPLVIGAVITHEAWRMAVVELGGRAVDAERGSHDGTDGPGVLAQLRAAAERLVRRYAGRVRGLGLAAPGLVHGGAVLDAPMLGWQGLDLRACRPSAPTGDPGAPAEALVFVAGNDATAAAVAEARRGAAAGAALHLHLRLDAGLGGAVTTHGTVLDGAHGLAGEFGHLPFGDPSARCPCGARGCWNTGLTGEAMARAVGAPPPPDQVTYARRLLSRAAAGEPAPLRVVREMGTALGRGTAGLVNALDADLVTLGGLAVDLLGVVPDAVGEALAEGLMSHRRAAPPAVLPAALGEGGLLVGAAEQAWSRLWQQL